MAKLSIEVFAPSLCGYTDRFVNVGYTPYCLPECIVMLSGSMIVCGLPLDALPGEDLKAKRKTLVQSTIDQVSGYVSNGGWMVRLKDIGCLVVPTGFLILKVAEEQSYAFRWSFSGDERDLARTGHALETLLKAYPEMQNPHFGYQQLLEWITSD